MNGIRTHNLMNKSPALESDAVDCLAKMRYVFDVFKVIKPTIHKKISIMQRCTKDMQKHYRYAKLHVFIFILHIISGNGTMYLSCV